MKTKKKISNSELFAWIFSMSKSFKKTKRLGNSISRTYLLTLKKKANFQLTVKKKDKTIQEYVRLLKLTKQEYQKLFQENKLLKERINSIEKEKIVKIAI